MYIRRRLSGRDKYKAKVFKINHINDQKIHKIHTILLEFADREIEAK